MDRGTDRGEADSSLLGVGEGRDALVLRQRLSIHALQSVSYQRGTPVWLTGCIDAQGYLAHTKHRSLGIGLL